MSALMPLASHGTRLPRGPARAERAPSALAPLFPPGLVVQVDGASGEELRAAALGWDVRYAQLGAGRFRGCWVGVHTANLQLCLEEWALATLKTGRVPRGTVTFLVPVGGSGCPRIQGRAVAAGGVVVLFDGDELDYRSAGPACLVSVSIDRTTLEGHVRALLGRQLGELRRHGRLSGLWTDGALLAQRCHDLADRAGARRSLLLDPALARGLERQIVDVLFAGFETPCVPQCPGRGRGLARKAEAWLRQNLAEPPTIAALCAEFQTSERTLHEAFREHLGTTPKAYLKTLRLNAARHALIRGDAKTRVTAVALDWGFLHFGWFSQDYRLLFGETPSQTLQRARMQAAPRGLGGGGMLEANVIGSRSRSKLNLIASHARPTETPGRWREKRP